MADPSFFLLGHQAAFNPLYITHFPFLSSECSFNRIGYRLEITVVKQINSMFYFDFIINLLSRSHLIPLEMELLGVTSVNIGTTLLDMPSI